VSFLGIDTGGTFTDFVLYRDQQLTIHKVLSTPHAPENAILQGISELNVDINNTAIIHGSTVATNAVLEKKGLKTAFITNHGLADLLTIGRQARKELFNLQPRPASPPVSKAYCLETGGRLAADGSVVTELTTHEVNLLVNQLKALAPDSIAICLMFSFLDDRYEQKLYQALCNDYFVSVSSEILPEINEYERGMTTWLNAYVSPLVKAYLSQLKTGLQAAPITIMQSSGGTISSEQVENKGANLLLSGPAGGLNAAKYLGELTAKQRILTFDMGGTSTDVALIDGEINLTNEGMIAGYPVGVPMVDMHTIGAGGGSIAILDSAGMLQVGPQSSGAYPGPVCYGRGGQLPTVTDANLVLERLQADAFLGGRMALNRNAALNALRPLAAQMSLTVNQVAQGIVDIANEHMAQALRVISIQRGIDPRNFVLMSFGGAGGLHVCALAEHLGITEAMVPIHSGVLSAMGMLVAKRSRNLSKTKIGRLKTIPKNTLTENFFQLEMQGIQALMTEGVKSEEITIQRSLDLRYCGQSYTLNIAWNGIGQSITAFHETHKLRFGHTLDEDVELVNMRIKLSGPQPEFTLKSENVNNLDLNLDKRDHKTRVVTRSSLLSIEQYIGPLIITEEVSTIYISPSWSCRVDKMGNLLLSRHEH